MLIYVQAFLLCMVAKTTNKWRNQFENTNRARKNKSFYQRRKNGRNANQDNIPTFVTKKCKIFKMNEPPGPISKTKQAKTVIYKNPMQKFPNHYAYCESEDTHNVQIKYKYLIAI